MQRYIFNIQYNQQDKSADHVWIDAVSKNAALRKLNRQFPGVYSIDFVRVCNEYFKQ